MDLETILKETLAAQQALAQTMAQEPTLPAQPRKREVLERLLERGVMQVSIDCTLPGVQVPDHFVGISGLLLNFSHNYATPLKLTDEVLEQDLSFSKVRHQVRVPLRAIRGAMSLVTQEVVEFQVNTGEDIVEGQDPPEPPQSA